MLGGTDGWSRALCAAFMQDHTLALLKAIGITEGAKPASKRSGGRPGRRATREARFSDEGSLSGQEPADPPGSLGAKLQELGKKLLQVRPAQSGPVCAYRLRSGTCTCAPCSGVMAIQRPAGPEERHFSK